jgi:hypothetical protein
MERQASFYLPGDTSNPWIAFGSGIAAARLFAGEKSKRFTSKLIHPKRNKQKHDKISCDRYQTV